MDRELSPLTGDYTSKTISTLANAAYIRLTTPLGSWWADGRVGSLLHLIQREKDLTRVGLIAQQYAEEALQPLLDDGRASQIQVTHQQPHNGWLILHIEIIDNRGETYRFKHPVKVI
ncbi:MULTISPECIES: phage GP46 family protein [Pasteurellaceae]|uniref:Phage GP46 family protein n=3 Tax=Pasteurellaceae TaxID=712 RepID=A0AAX2S1K8_HISSO|nr:MULTISPECIES: phage GP46 family protein [Pasteurellaceae]ACA32344.1 phage GP46 family protein [Histophilus somni 2336]MEE3607576.1 phage GP46 family protein [Avibacterium paragallinarum]MEE3620048.1 phage GP46 family protein [Avibacterium paragallinarum]MEE3667732.1 phage GP46 family protein [Avibacterium paragallinarum]MEE3679960.1 phage GP46 family protein [Avibacterium paragallinarum]